MKDKTLKSAFFASLILFSLACFVYVNTAPIDRALSVERVTQTSKSEGEKAEKNAKMPDLALVKNVLTIFQKFIPAK